MSFYEQSSDYDEFKFLKNNNNFINNPFKEFGYALSMCDSTTKKDRIYELKYTKIISNEKMFKIISSSKESISLIVFLISETINWGNEKELSINILLNDKEYVYENIYKFYNSLEKFDNTVTVLITKEIEYLINMVVFEITNDTDISENLEKNI